MLYVLLLALYNIVAFNIIQDDGRGAIAVNGKIVKGLLKIAEQIGAVLGHSPCC